MLSGTFEEVKEQLSKIGRLDRELNLLMRECIKDLTQARDYEKLFSNLPKPLVETQNGVIKNTREIVSICIPRIKGTAIELTTSDINVIKQKLEDNDRLLNEFQALLRQNLK
jgi:hypothetical protein